MKRERQPNDSLANGYRHRRERVAQTAKAPLKLLPVHACLPRQVSVRCRRSLAPTAFMTLSACNASAVPTKANGVGSEGKLRHVSLMPTKSCERIRYFRYNADMFTSVSGLPRSLGCAITLPKLSVLRLTVPRSQRAAAAEHGGPCAQRAPAMSGGRPRPEKIESLDNCVTCVRVSQNWEL